MDLFKENNEIPNQFLGAINGSSLFLKREDLLHPIVSGNKFRKLKYILNFLISRSILFLKFSSYRRKIFDNPNAVFRKIRSR